MMSPDLYFKKLMEVFSRKYEIRSRLTPLNKGRLIMVSYIGVLSMVIRFANF